MPKFTDIQTYDDQKKGKESTYRHGNAPASVNHTEEHVRKEADSKFKAALTKALEDLSKPDNVYAKEMAKLQKRFNELVPTRTIHQDFAALHSKVFGPQNSKHNHGPIKQSELSNGDKTGNQH
jgi:hypothetical protein